MRKPIKVIIISIIGVASFTLFFFFFFNINFNPSDTTQQPEVINLTLSIDYKNGTIGIFENFSLDQEKTTVFDAVDKWCNIIYTEYPNGDYYITNINGIDIGWIYFVNNISPSVAVNRYHLNNGDYIHFEHV